MSQLWYRQCNVNSSATNLDKGNAVVNYMTRVSKRSRQVLPSDTKGNKGQITLNAIELQVPDRLPPALFCLGFL